MQTREEIAARAAQLIENHFTKFHRKTLVPITEATSLADLGADSLDSIEIIMEFEDILNVEITDAEAEDIKTFGDAVSFIATKLGVAEAVAA